MRTPLLPREHGAYGQLIFPMVTALVVSGVTLAGLLMSLAMTAAFLAHEPALVLIGMRGPRARRELSQEARRTVAALGLLAAAAGVGALVLAPRSMWWSFGLPLAPAALLIVAIAMRQEKSWHAEVAVALAFSLAAVPLSLVADGRIERALAIAIPFALIFVAGTLAVRTVILRVRGGGDARATASTRISALCFIAAGVAIAAFAARRALLPWSVLIAAAPGLALAGMLALSSPPVARLKTIGWLLVGASTAAAIIVMVAL